MTYDPSSRLRVAQAVLFGELEAREIVAATRTLVGEVLEAQEYDPAPENNYTRAAIRVTNHDNPGSHDLMVWAKPSRNCCPYDGPHTVVTTVYDTSTGREEGIQKLRILASRFGGFVTRDIDGGGWAAVKPSEDAEFCPTLQERTWLGLVETVGMDAASTIMRLAPWGLDDLCEVVARYRDGVHEERASMHPGR